MGIINKSVGIALIALSSIANAQFTGHTIQARHLFPTQSSYYQNPQTAVVGEGVEFTSFGDASTNADLSTFSITLGFNQDSIWNQAEFNGPEFYDINGTIPKIYGVTLNQASSMPGFDSSRISFDEDHIWVNWQGLHFNPSMKVILDVRFDPLKPEPVPAVSISNVGDGTLTVSWTAPADNGSPITKYTVTGVPGGTCTSAIDSPATTPDTSCTVTGLTNGTPYKFTVVATNAIGDSVASPESAEAIPSADLMFVGAGPNITLAGGVVAATYSQTLQVTGGLPPYTFSVTGELPPGLELDTDTGIISGTPTTPGTYSFSVMAMDSAVQPTLAAKAVHVAEQTFTIVITAAPVVQAAPTPVPALGGLGLLLLSGAVAGSMGLMRRRNSN
ncbi:fibronectin type III domain-containing protein [Comamonas sp. MYb21]|uniref:fibronectin type III domain-containing protein n=1 Tax=Comamonas sp. MYb21 TaxID=1848648 RepID=UPI0030B049EC